MSHIFNPIATVDQLFEGRKRNSQLPQEIQESIRFYTARLTQAAGLLLHLPQDITAQANVLLFRYWIGEDLMKHEFGEVSAATIYLTAKISASPRSLRSVINVYAYLFSDSSMLSPLALKNPPTHPPDPQSYYLSESSYIAIRVRILHLEGQILNAVGFLTDVSLPHPITIIYLQILDVFDSDDAQIGHRVAQSAIAHLNVGLLNPQMLYLTHQPCQLATAAIFLAAREIGICLPACSWWEVFDCDREDLGFLAMSLGSLESIVQREKSRWGEERGMIFRNDVYNEVTNICPSLPSQSYAVQKEADEESEMAKLLDEKVGGISKSNTLS